MKKRVNFGISTTGSVKSYYLWVERKNVKLKNKKGYLLLEPRSEEYDLVYLAKGQNSATFIVTVTSSGKTLAKRKSKIGINEKTSGMVTFNLEQE
ncbi:MAG: hypothetical protein AB2604_01615 [Candidatus Thiodiazotropha taylori]